MQNKIFKISLILLGLLLPLHGLISVIGDVMNFDQIRYWKELVLLVLMILIALKYFPKNINVCVSPLPRGEVGRGLLKNLQKIFFSPILPLILLFFWCIILWFYHGHTTYHTIALRYLLEPLLFFSVIYLLIKNNISPLTLRGDKGVISEKNPLNPFNPSSDFLNAFLLGSLLSLLFGIWAKFFGGFEVLQNFYSQTISSWVPGQTLPIYHETGEFIRMQGASSGPVAFGYLQFVAFFIVLFYFPSLAQRGARGSLMIKILQVFLLMLFTIGIYQSGSRAAMLAEIFVIIFFLIYFIRQKFFPHSQISPLEKTQIALVLVKILLALIVFSASLNFILEKIPTTFSTRVSDIDHVIKPLEAISLGLEKPITGNLSQIGPAARMRNLSENNNDYALLAENIFADFFAQIGLIGLILFLWFWLNIFLHTKIYGKIFVLSCAFLGSLATIFDMTPIAITICILFALISPPCKRGFRDFNKTA